MTIPQMLIRLREGISFVYDTVLARCYKSSFGTCGKNVLLKPSTSIFKGIQNINISDDVRIARYATIYSTGAKVFIGRKVGIAPYLKIITGNHRTNVVGHFMFDGDYEKSPDDDKDVIIKGDNWLGINVTILSGVTIGRGCVVASGSVVNKSCPPYSIVGGVPAKVLKWRFSIEEILTHELALYPPEERYTEEDLVSIRKKYEMMSNISKDNLQSTRFLRESLGG